MNKKTKLQPFIKRTLQLFVLFIFFGQLSAQINVVSFIKNEGDLDASTWQPKPDKFGNKCAIIKVETTETGFKWDSDSEITAAESKPAQWWIYVSAGTKHLIISHNLFGKIDYSYTEPILAGRVYKLELVTGKVTTEVKEEIISKDIVINTIPLNAMITIDDVFVKTGSYKGKLKPGKHTIRVEAPMYHEYVEIVEVSDVAINKTDTLKPAFGSITVKTLPESGAKVYLDKVEQSENTPCTIEKVPSGEHTVMVVKEMYNPKPQKVTVNDGQNTQIPFTLEPNFSTIKITAPESKIFINAEQKGINVWEGRLVAGVYNIEAKRQNYKDDVKPDIEVVVGRNDTINMHPTPITGALDILTYPPDAVITIDGTNYGTTPNKINDLLIGDYKLMIAKDGYSTLSKQIKIEDKKTTTINDTLYNGRVVSISTNTNEPTSLFIDDKPIVKTPYKGNLTFGKHTLRIEKDERTEEKEITIQDNGGEVNFIFTLPLKTIKNEEIKKEPTQIQLTGHNVKIYSTPSDASLYIDGKFVGTTTYSGYLNVGKHTVRVSKKGNVAEKTIRVDPDGGETSFSLEIQQASYSTNSKQIVETFHADKTSFVYIASGISYPIIGSSSGGIMANSIGYEFKVGVSTSNPWGVYAKLASNFSNTTPEYSISTIPASNYYEMDNSVKESSYSRMGAVAGAMLNLKPVMIYAGAGWGQYKHYVRANLYNYSDDSLVKSFILSDKSVFTGIETNLGVILYKRPFSISIGISNIQFRYTELALNVGLIL